MYQKPNNNKKKYRNYNDLYEYRVTFKCIEDSFPKPKENNEFWDLNPITPKGSGWQLVNSQAIMKNNQMIMLYTWERPVLEKRTQSMDEDRIPSHISNQNAKYPAG